MNWVDYVVIGVIAGYALIGYARGFIYAVFKVASFFVAALFSLQFYPYVSRMLISVIHLDVTMKNIISNNLTKAVSSGQGGQGASSEAIKGLVSSWGLPSPVEAVVVKNLSVQASQAAGNIIESLSQSLSLIAVNIVSIIIIFAVVSFILIFARNLLEGLARLPIFKQINRVGGIVFGTLQGVMIVYIAFAILTLFASSQELKNVFTDINSSVLAKNFYTHNLLLIWAFGGKGN